MVLLAVIILLVVAFDFINGFHDAANSIATIVTTKILTPMGAVIWAAFFNFLAFFIAKYITGFGIVDTVSKIVIPDVVGKHLMLYVVLAGLMAAITWNLFTWWSGIPSSSSHTLIGGFAGAGIAVGGFHAIHASIIGRISLFIVLAPIIGMLAGMLFTSLTLHIARHVKPHKADKWFKRLQLLSSALLSIGHGLNDTQNMMGIMVVALIAFNESAVVDTSSIPDFLQMTSLSDGIHDWVPMLCYFAIACGTLSGGWKIMKTMGSRITKITPVEGFCAETASALTLFLTEALHIPVSTTHVVSGSIMGVGATKRLSAVRWGVSMELIVAWVITIPISALLGMLYYSIITLFI